MKKIAFLIFPLAAVIVSLGLMRSVHADSFNPNNLMDDGVFNNASSMKAADIDFWLNHYFPNSCISTNHGFSAPDPTGYSPSTGFTYGGPVSAGRVIYDAATAYGLNPEVLLATLQKEESLVDGSAGCSTLRISASVGYGCPDGGTTYNYSNLNPAMYYINGNPVNSISGTCVKSAADVGFAQQLIHASWLLKFGEQRSEGNVNWNVQATNFPEQGDSLDNSDDPQTCYGGPMTQGTFKRCSADSSGVFYDGYITIDGQGTHMDTGATAALYWYTPHFSGNQNFDNIFQSWFGSIYVPKYSAQAVWQQIYTDSSKSTAIGWGANLLTNQSAWAVVVMKNTGTTTWTNAGSPGVSDIRLATYGPWGRQSPFCTGNWVINCTRAAIPDEASVAPGQTGTFEFPVSAPAQPGQYNESFGLVIDGVSTLAGSPMNFEINVAAPDYSAQAVWQQIYTDSSKSTAIGWGADLNPRQSAYAVVVMKNTSNFTWTKTGGPYDVRLATFGPWGRQSAFCDNNWLINCARPAGMDETSVAPGQTGTFEFPILAPSKVQNYNENFGLVVDGKSTFNSGFMNFQLNVKLPSAQAVWQQVYTDNSGSPGTALGWGPPLNSPLTHGQKYWAVVVMKNTGTTTWIKNGNFNLRLATYNPWGRQNQFCSNSFGSVTWLINCTRPATFSEASVPSGSTGTFTFPLIAPSAGTYNESFGLVVDGVSTLNSGLMNFQLTIQ